MCERLTELLTDPTSGQVHQRLRPVFDELVGSERPQTGIWWLRKKPGVGPRLLGQMARGEVAISHDTFRALPSDRAHNYLRELLAAVGVLAAYEPRIERILPWLEAKLADVPTDQADLVRRFAHWHVLRHLRRAADQGRLTKAITDRAREQISAAIRVLAFLDGRGTTAADATQDDLERYQAHKAGTLSSESAFVTWLRTSRTNTALTIPSVPSGPPAVTVSDTERWAHVERLLHDTTLRGYTRIGGLFTLLFAQPLSRIVAMRTSQVTLGADGRVDVAFGTIGMQMPALVDRLIADHLQQRGQSLYVARDTGWLFPGGSPAATWRPRTSAPSSSRSASSRMSHARPPCSSSPPRCPHQCSPSFSPSPTPTPPTGPSSPPATGPATSPTAPAASPRIDQRLRTTDSPQTRDALGCAWQGSVQSRGHDGHRSAPRPRPARRRCGTGTPAGRAAEQHRPGRHRRRCRHRLGNRAAMPPPPRKPPVHRSNRRAPGNRGIDADPMALQRLR
ncbi:MAG TPA: hypothetical protein VM684_15040 [Gaiellales bacterium]|nr:hypothetical protein [Gaiellales bacterium]